MLYQLSRHRVVLLSLASSFMLGAPVAQAALTLTVDVFDATTLTLTVSGTLDADTEGNMFPGQFSISGDPHGSLEFVDTSAPFEAFGTILIGGSEAEYTIVGEPPFGHAFIFFLDMGAPVAAGTEISGTVTLNGGFTAFPELMLWSGGDFDGSSASSNRLEAVAVPEPSIGILSLLGGGLLLRRRRS